MTKRSCLRMGIVGRLRLRRTSDLKAFTADSRPVFSTWLIPGFSTIFRGLKIKRFVHESLHRLVILHFVIT